jgi:RNA polymerase sigma-70 factor (ECF subfamily)
MAAELDVGPMAARAGAEAAGFEERLRPLLGPAYRLAHAMLRDRPEAEDAVQEAALNAWRAFATFRDQGSGMQPWFLTIVANQCRARMRAHWWQVWRQPEIDRGSASGPEGEVVLRAQLAVALDRLTPDHRAALHLRYQLDLPNEEIARILGLRVGTVKSRLHRALRRLRAAINEEELDDDA